MVGFLNEVYMNKMTKPKTTINDEKIPLWFKTGKWLDMIDYETDTSTRHYKVTITVEIPEHDGYCSDRGLDENDTDFVYVKEIQCAAFPMDTWDMIDFKQSAFEYRNGCERSPYCNYPTKVNIIRIEKFI